MQSKDETRKPWHGTAGAPKGPSRTLEGFLDEVWDTRPLVVRAHPRRALTKSALAKRIRLSRGIFNQYYENIGATWPLPPADHLVYVVQRLTGIVRWASPSLYAALHCTCANIVDRHVADALRDGEDLHKVMPEVFDIGQRLYEANDGLIENYSMYLVRHDDHARIYVDLAITYGTGYDVFFVDAVPTGRIELAPKARSPLRQSDLGDDMFNVDPSIVYVRAGEGKTRMFLEKLGYRS